MMTLNSNRIFSDSYILPKVFAKIYIINYFFMITFSKDKDKGIADDLSLQIYKQYRKFYVVNEKRTCKFWVQFMM